MIETKTIPDDENLRKKFEITNDSIFLLEKQSNNLLEIFVELKNAAYCCEETRELTNTTINDISVFINLTCPYLQSSIQLVRDYFMNIQEIQKFIEYYEIEKANENVTNKFENSLSLLKLTDNSNNTKIIKIKEIEKRLEQENKKIKNAIISSSKCIKLEAEKIETMKGESLSSKILYYFVSCFKDFTLNMEKMETSLKEFELKQKNTESMLLTNKKHTDLFNLFNVQVKKVFENFVELKTLITSVINFIIKNEKELDPAKAAVFLKMLKVQASKIVSSIATSNLNKKFESIRPNFGYDKTTASIYEIIEKQIWQDHFKDSKIINGDEMNFLKESFPWLQRTILLFSGGDQDKFHEKCNNKKHTILLLKLGNKIAGGFNPIGWNGDNLFMSEKAFLFSVTNKKKYLIRKEKTQFAIDNHPYDGPIFGYNPTNIQYCKKCNCYLHDLRVCLPNNSGHSFLENYGNDDDYHTSLFGENNFCFKVDKIELFELV